MMRRSFGWVALSGALILVLGACGGGTKETKASGPFMAIVSPAPNASIAGNVVLLDVTVDGIEIRKADGDTSGKTGHFHVFIDRDPVAPGQVIGKAPDIVHSADSPIKLTGLSTGAHTFAVVLGDGSHARIGSLLKTLPVTVTGPSVKATLPAAPAAGEAFSIDVTVEGVALVKADGDTSGRTGHLHVFIDKDPTPVGQAIPKEEGIIHSAATTIEIPALAAGEHTLTVVLGNGAHVPFDPPVQHTLKFTL